MVITKIFFFFVLALVFIQRLLELRISKRNVAYVLSQGGKEYSSNYIGLIRILHISWFLAMVVEVHYFSRPFIWFLAIIGIIGTLAGQSLRYFSMKALSNRWTLPIMIIPNSPVINKGIYRYLRHPNWLGVVLELALVPLIHTAYFTAIVFSLINAFLMYKRILAEEEALTTHSNYLEVFMHIPRFLPKG